MRILAKFMAYYFVTVDRLVDFGPLACGLLDKALIVRLISRGLVYLDVPVKNEDYIYGSINK